MVLQPSEVGMYQTQGVRLHRGGRSPYTCQHHESSEDFCDVHLLESILHCQLCIFVDTFCDVFVDLAIGVLLDGLIP